MKYYVSNGIHIVEVPVSDFKIVMVDKKKKSAATKNYSNCNFFGTYHENGEAFTLPVGHVVCDFDAKSKWVKKYCEERGKFLTQTKYQFDCSKWTYMNEFYGKKVTTLFISGGSATMVDAGALPDGLDYAVSGVPVMRDGEDVKFATYVKGQGWGGSSLYATWHMFIGLKADAKTIYVMGMKTTTSNMILSAEAYRKFKALGMRNVIKLDGGGSFYLNVDGKAVASTSENRLINAIMTFGELEKSAEKNPYPVPTRALRQGMTGNDVRWLQWQLNALGYECDIDGSFGPATKKVVLKFQKDQGLEQDASVGPATRGALIAALQ